jgi:DNA-binding IclR family transcriptional regulator
LTSSVGRLFGAYLSRAITQPFIDRELARVPHPGAPLNSTPKKMTPADVDALFRSVRRAGIARVQGDLNPGLHGLSAPVFDHAGAIVGAITIMGSPGLIDTSLNSRNAAVLAASVEEVSKRMGWNPDSATELKPSGNT